MSTDYYLVQTDPTPIYGRAKVAQKSGGNVSLWTDDDIDWVGVDGDMVDAPNVTMPATVADLIEPQERTCRRLREFVVYRDGSTGEYRVACSACGFSADPQEWAETYNFCPRCGAKVVS